MTSGFEDVSIHLLVLIAITTLGPMQFGYHLAELNAPQSVITCQKSVSNFMHILSFGTSSASFAASSAIEDCIPMDKVTFATVTSVYTVGALFGALVSGPFASAKGRLFSMRLTTVAYFLGSFIETVAGSVPVMSLGRILNGIGAGGSTVIVPVYISEIAPLNRRGFFGAFTQISIGIGILITQTLGYFLSHDGSWRGILGVGVITAAMQGLGLLLVPESPVWIADARGDLLGAKRTLQRIRGKSVNIDDEVRTWGLRNVFQSNEEEALLGNGAEPHADAPPASPVKVPTDHLGFWQVACDPFYRPAIIAVVGLMFAQQFCGVNSILLYSVALLADLLPISSGVMTILLSVINLLATVVCSSLPDKLGRKTCLLLSIVGQGSSSLIMAFSIVFEVKILTGISVLFFVGFFAIGLGPVPFIMASELVGQEAVGATQSWALSGSYIATFCVLQFFPILDQALNTALGGAGWVFFIFATLSVVFAVFVQVRVPETKGKRDIDEVWGRVRRID